MTSLLLSLPARSPTLASLLWMGARDARTRKGKVFKGSNGLARPAKAGASSGGATGWWHRLRSLADIPVAGGGRGDGGGGGAGRSAEGVDRLAKA